MAYHTLHSWTLQFSPNFHHYTWTEWKKIKITSYMHHIQPDHFSIQYVMYGYHKLCAKYKHQWVGSTNSGFLQEIIILCTLVTINYIGHALSPHASFIHKETRQWTPIKEEIQPSLLPLFPLWRECMGGITNLVPQWKIWNLQSCDWNWNLFIISFTLHSVLDKYIFSGGSKPQAVESEFLFLYYTC